MKPILPRTHAWITQGLVISALSITLQQAAPVQALPLFGLTQLRTAASPLALPHPSEEIAQDDEGDAGLKAVSKSPLAAIKLPKGAFLLTGKEQTEALVEALAKFAKQNRVTLGAT